MFHHEVIPVTAFEQNTSLVWCDETMDAAFIDPGGDIPKLMAAVKRRNVNLKAIWLTHPHIDHAGATGTLARTLGLPIIGPHEADQYWIDGLPQQSKMFGFPEAEPFVPTRWLNEGDTVTIGHCTLQVRHCPGHTPGHVIFFEPTTKHAFVGDVLFAGGIGRSDFPGGDHDTLINSIHQRLLTLGDDVSFTPGHGPDSTMGRERCSNPYL